MRILQPLTVLLVGIAYSNLASGEGLPLEYHLDRLHQDEEDPGHGYKAYRVLPVPLADRQRAGGHANGAARRRLLGHSDYAAMCLVAKNEARFVREWVMYHRWLGFKKFYIFDHNSSTPLMRPLYNLMRKGVVDYYFFAGHHGVGWLASGQAFAYSQCLRLAKGHHKWLAFLDADEYVVLRPGVAPRLNGTTNASSTNASSAGAVRPSIGTFLERYERHGALGINWVMFGSSGHDRRPPGGTLESYTKCMPPAADVHKHVKVIVNVDRTTGIGATPHGFHYEHGAGAVNELWVPFAGPTSAPPSHTKVVLHHYFTRSKQDFVAKSARGRATGTERPKRSMREFKEVDAAATLTCPEGPALWEACCAVRERARKARRRAARRRAVIAKRSASANVTSVPA